MLFSFHIKSNAFHCNNLWCHFWAQRAKVFSQKYVAPTLIPTQELWILVCNKWTEITWSPKSSFFLRRTYQLWKLIESFLINEILKVYLQTNVIFFNVPIMHFRFTISKLRNNLGNKMPGKILSLLKTSMIYTFNLIERSSKAISYGNILCNVRKQQ